MSNETKKTNFKPWIWGVGILGVAVLIFSAFTGKTDKPKVEERVNPSPIGHATAAYDEATGLWTDTMTNTFYNVTTKKWEPLTATGADADGLTKFTVTQHGQTIRSTIATALDGTTKTIPANINCEVFGWYAASPRMYATNLGKLKSTDVRLTQISNGNEINYTNSNSL